MERPNFSKSINQDASRLTIEERQRQLRDMSPEGIARRRAEAAMLYEERRKADLIAAGGRRWLPDDDSIDN